MVTKLSIWHKVKRRRAHVQLDRLGHDFYLITDYDDGVQFVCDSEHIEKMKNALNNI